MTGQQETDEILNLIFQVADGCLQGLQSPQIFPPLQGSPAFEHMLDEIVSDVQDRLVLRRKSAVSVER